MCLKYIDTETKRVRELIGKTSKNTKVFYKLYEVVKAFDAQGNPKLKLYSPYMNNYTINKPGDIVSNRSSKNMYGTEELTHNIDRGIHVFETGNGVQKELLFFNRVWKDKCYVSVAVQCSLKDFVAAGYFQRHESSVFMKVKITPQTWKKLEKQLLPQSKE